MVICAECDGEMTLSNEKGKPMILLTGDIESGVERIAVCKVCGHRVVIKD
jgi:DNA-directed RNA polymerase subunit RPC12/RpoP